VVVTAPVPTALVAELLLFIWSRGLAAATPEYSRMAMEFWLSEEDQLKVTVSVGTPVIFVAE
jgi:hypothetical protein